MALVNLDVSISGLLRAFNTPARTVKIPYLTMQPLLEEYSVGLMFTRPHLGKPQSNSTSVSDRETEGLSWPHWVPGLLTVSPGLRKETRSQEEEAKMKAGTWAKGITQALLGLTLPT